MDQISIFVASVLDQVLVPHALTATIVLPRPIESNSKSDVEGRRSKQTRWELVHLRVEEGQFEQVLCQEEDDVVSFGNF